MESAINSPHIDAAEDQFFDALAAEEAPVEAGDAPGGDEEAEDAPVVDPEPATPQEPAQSVRTGGSLEREYVVFQKVPLTEKTLRHLLAQFDAGRVAQVRVAYIELHRATTRTDKAAVGEAYSLHHKELGATCDLAAVSARAFKDRHVAPRATTPETRLQIT